MAVLRLPFRQKRRLMTTIAYRAGVLAADSSCIYDGALIHKVRKIFRLQDGCIVGFAGTLTEGLKFVDWFDDGADDETKPGQQGLTAIVVRPSGRVTIYESGVPITPQKFKYLAIGSGHLIALGAMHQGASAISAVRAAIKHDVNSVGPVLCMKLRR